MQLMDKRGGITVKIDDKVEKHRLNPLMNRKTYAQIVTIEYKTLK